MPTPCPRCGRGNAPHRAACLYCSFFFFPLFFDFVGCWVGEADLVREASLDDFEQQRRAFLRRAIELGLVRKLEADGVPFDPANGGFEARTLAELQLDQVP